MIAIAPTDDNWFEYVRDEINKTNINFWTPTPWNIRQLEDGDRFYFMRKAPVRKIGGYGHFIRYENMGAEEEWKEFGIGNGVGSLDELIDRASEYAGSRSENFEPTENPEIGCVVLRDPVLFNEENHIDLQEHEVDFPAQVVKHKYFPDRDTLRHPSETESAGSEDFSLVEEESKTYSTTRRKDRKKQHRFRQRVFEAYDHECCVTGEETSDVLEAAHIQPYTSEESNHVQNGIPLRVDLHRLFDTGLMTVTTDGKVQVSEKVSSKVYREFDGAVVAKPSDPNEEPSSEALRYHNRLVFRGALSNVE